MKKLIKRMVGEKNYIRLWERIKKPYLTKKAIRQHKVIDFQIVDTEKLKLKSYGDGVYGTYVIFDDYLDENSVVYSLGIGMDASFDLNLMNKFNCKVYAYDPDKHAIDYVDSTLCLHNKNFKFFPYAISTDGGVKQFYEHEREGANDGSGSFYRYGESTGMCDVACKTIKDVMSEFGHKHIDLLKMDIEGMEYEIIDYLIENKIEVKQIAMELHGRFFDDCKEKNDKLIRQLDVGGFLPVWNQMWWYAGQECTFIHKSLL